MKIIERLRREVSREINGSSNRAQRWEADIAEVGVVGNLISTSNALEKREANVGELAIGYKCQTSLASSERTNGGQVGCSNAVHVVSVEAERSVHSCQ